MKKIAILLIYMLIGVILDAAPVRSLVSARNTVVASTDQKQYTAADYVQDGLIAMWDGIENVGWGVHDENATTWVDLVGAGCPLQITNFTSCIWRDKCIMNTNTQDISIGAIRKRTLLPWLQNMKMFSIVTNRNAVLTSDYTQEMVSSPKNKGFRIYDINGFDYYMVQNILIWTPSCDWSYSSKRGYVYNALDLEQNQIMSYSGVARYNGESAFYVDNRFMTSSSVPCNIYYNVQNNNYVGITVVSNGSIYCLRYYNRALSKEEISYNYKIDKVRFNLP